MIAKPHAAPAREGWLAGRVRIAQVAALLALVFCAARAAQWTLLEGEELARRAESNFFVQMRLPAPRGAILDREGRAWAQNVTDYTVELARYRSAPEDVARMLGEISALTGRDVRGFAEAICAARPRWKRIQIARGLSLDQVTPLYERRHELPGLFITERTQRRYPLGRAAAPVVGYTGFLTAAELDAALAEGLPRDARVGRAGLERRYEKALRGETGLETAERDARGRLFRSRVERPGRPGRDLTISLDARLQTLAYELLGGDAPAAQGYRGVIAAMKPDTGELLALAVRPTFDPERPGAAPREGEEISYLNRAVMELYPPGSPYKIVTSLAALRAGRPPSYRINCTGSYRIPEAPRRVFRDHNNPAGYGWLDLPDALKFSSNVYYYQTAWEIGVEGQLAAARLLGFDRLTGVDLPGEAQSALAKMDPSTLQPGEIVLMGIGQGPVAVTPLQVLRAICAVATRGRLPTPHIGLALTDAFGRREALNPPPPERLAVPPDYFEAIIEGMYRVCYAQGGTASKAGFPPGWRVCGKTGTAERPPAEPDAWFVGFAPRENPELAVAVLLENAGHGGEMAAPLARELFAAYFEDVRYGPSAAPGVMPPAELSRERPAPAPGRSAREKPVPGGGIERESAPAPAERDSTTTRSLAPMPSASPRPASDYQWSHGAVIRGPRDEKKLALIFTGGGFGEGGHQILDVLGRNQIKGSFFFTGDFLANPEFDSIVRRVVAEGHYLGPHSHRHLLYCPWDDRAKTLVTREEFQEDLEENLRAIEGFGVPRERVTWWIPPYEWYNDDITSWSLAMNLRLFNFTPGTLSHTDYTEDGARNYRSNDQIFQSVLEYALTQPDSLNGFLLLTHVGAGPKRTEKFFTRLPELLDELYAMKYELVRVDELLAGAPLREK